MAQLPFVTVVIPCLNESGYIEDCMRSVLDQEYPPDRMEILVVDGGSTDGTQEILTGSAESTSMCAASTTRSGFKLPG